MGHDKKHAGEHIDPLEDPIADATITTPGLMAATDKSKLDGIAAGADVTGSNPPQSHDNTYHSTAYQSATDVGTAITNHAAVPAAHHSKTTVAKGTVDGSITVDSGADIALNGTKGDTNPLNHDRYTDGEADARIGVHAALPSAHHSRYADSEAVTAMGAKDDTNPLNHDKTPYPPKFIGAGADGLVPDPVTATGLFLKDDGTWGAGGGGTTDADAIHDNVAGEISAITEKTAPVNADLIIIEDSADSNNKKRVQLQNTAGRGCHSTPPYLIQLAGATGSGWGIDNTERTGFAMLAGSGPVTTGTMSVTEHGPADYRSGMTIRIRHKRTGTISMTATLYINGTADATINGLALTPGTSWGDETITPGSTINPDDRLFLQIDGTGLGNGEDYQVSMVDWDYLRKVN